MHTRTVYGRDLTLVARPEPNRVPLALGNWVHLNSGGPAMLVVDCGGDQVTVAYRRGEVELTLPRVTLTICNPPPCLSST